jgi:hypothetical protein
MIPWWSWRLPSVVMTIDDCPWWLFWWYSISLKLLLAGILSHSVGQWASYRYYWCDTVNGAIIQYIFSIRRVYSAVARGVIILTVTYYPFSNDLNGWLTGWYSIHCILWLLKRIRLWLWWWLCEAWWWRDVADDWYYDGSDVTAIGIIRLFYWHYSMTFWYSIHLLFYSVIFFSDMTGIRDSVMMLKRSWCPVFCSYWPYWSMYWSRHCYWWLEHCVFVSPVYDVDDFITVNISWWYSSLMMVMMTDRYFWLEMQSAYWPTVLWRL